MASVYYLLVVVLLATAGLAKSEDVCQKEELCKCTTKNGQQIDLTRLNKKPFQATSENTMYYYNPCKPFTMGGSCKDTFVCKYGGDKGESGIALGDEATSHFEYQNDYFLSYNQNDTYTKVLLHCPKNDTSSTQFSFVKYDEQTKTYHLKLTTPYACPHTMDVTTTAPENGATGIISTIYVGLVTVISLIATRVV